MDPFTLPKDMTKTPAKKDGLVEDFGVLSLSKLGRGILRRQDKKRGSISIADFHPWPRVDYEIETRPDDSKVLNLWYRPTEKSLPIFQEVLLEKVCVTFGWRGYMICPSCGSLRLKLHFSHLGFARCRECLNLAYESTRINHSRRIFQVLRRYNKVRLMQTEVKRITYGNGYTRKAKAVLKLSARWLSKEEKTKVDADMVKVYS